MPGRAKAGAPGQASRGGSERSLWWGRSEGDREGKGVAEAVLAEAMSVEHVIECGVSEVGSGVH